MIARRAVAAALVAAACACAPPPSAAVIVIGPAPPDDYREEAAHDAVDALDLAAQLSIPPEAMIPLAGYLAGVHRRLHGAFSEGALLDFERTRPAFEGDLAATLDFALAEADGRVVDLRLAKTSGVEAFDATTIAGALHASPFGAPPREILADDQRAHLAWRFHRRASDPCALADATVMRGEEP